MSEENNQTDFPNAFGWIGLGAMGFPMALQLRAKVPTRTILYIYDVDAGAMERFVKETSGSGIGANVVVANNAREVAERSVCGFGMSD
jgi:3-hydroxyisobutyrate dehydrogenase-like beta-hydroxyacid dehydrogenase